MYLSKVFDIDFVRRLHGTTESRSFEPCKGKLKIVLFDAQLEKDYDQRLELLSLLFVGIFVKGEFKGSKIVPMCGALILQENDSLCDAPLVFKMVEAPTTASIVNLIVALLTGEMEHIGCPADLLESVSLDIDGETVMVQV